MKNKPKKPVITLDQQTALTLIHFARRYCDGRMTAAPQIFNELYEKIVKENPWIQDMQDTTIPYFPYAQDGMYNRRTNTYDALPKKYHRKKVLQD